MARFIWRYDRRGNKLLEEHYGDDGELKGRTSGIARSIRRYDDRGNLVLQEYYGVD